MHKCLFFSFSDDVQRFAANAAANESEGNFKLMEEDGNFLLIGAT